MPAFHTTGPSFPAIPPLVTRHAGDAAFYWQQRDSSTHSPLVGLQQLMEFDRLLNAHLDGMRAAGEAGWGIALAQLQRWARAPEAFVCAVLALEHAKPATRLTPVWAAVEKDPGRMLRGLISALAWVPADRGLPWCHHWLGDERMPAALAVAAWRALALRPDWGDAGAVDAAFRHALPRALASPDPHLRAAACRVLGRLDEQRLLPFLQDPEPAVRAEAAIGLMEGLRLNSDIRALGASQQQALRSEAAGALWLSTNELSGALPSLGGLRRNQAQHRLMRWLCHLGLAAPMGHAGVARLIDLLPARLGLWFVLHHGDGHYLPWVVRHLSDPQVSRLAGWVWSALTGVDLHPNGLALPPRAPGQALRPTDTLDPGLAEPDAAAIERLALRLPSHAVSLHGRTVDDALLDDALVNAPQALRWIAARRLVRGGGGATPGNRAPARSQQARTRPQWQEAEAA